MYYRQWQLIDNIQSQVKWLLVIMPHMFNKQKNICTKKLFFFLNNSQTLIWCIFEYVQHDIDRHYVFANIKHENMNQKLSGTSGYMGLSIHKVQSTALDLK